MYKFTDETTKSRTSMQEILEFQNSIFIIIASMTDSNALILTNRETLFSERFLQQKILKIICICT